MACKGNRIVRVACSAPSQSDGRGWKKAVREMEPESVFVHGLLVGFVGGVEARFGAGTLIALQGNVAEVAYCYT